MPANLPPSALLGIKSALRVAIERGIKPDHHAIASNCNTTYGTVCYHYRKLWSIKATGGDHRKKSGRRRVVTPEIELAVAELLAFKPTLHQRKLAEFVSDQFNVKLSQPRVSVLMQRLGYIRKKVKPKEQTKMLRAPAP